MHTKRKRSTGERKCQDEKSYDFFKCVESYFYRKRGCQFPWNVYEDLDVPICSTLSQLLKSLKESGSNQSLGKDRDWWSNYERTIRTNGECPQPCNVTSYELKYEIKGFEDAVSFDIGFKNFVFEQKDEFRSCDFSCLIGELGGNLGFFLGGSLLIIIEFTLTYLIPKIRVKKMDIK